MALGDLVSAIYTTSTTFQPASGVQLVITQFLATDDNRLMGRGDIDTSSTNIAFTSSTGNSSGIRFFNGFIQKFFIDNSSYLRFDAGSGVGYFGFSGIQTK